jgi:thioredoxin-like negative regulator of GroEL
VNIDAIPDAMYAFNIEAFPTFVSFRNGQKIGEFVGGSEQNIKNAVEKF